MKDQERDVVFGILQQMLANSPERSYKRLNPALWSTLSSCIEADLPFQPDTFKRIHEGLRGHYWFGDGEGSHSGERLYTLACGVGHSGAQQSFENWVERPACLWEEDAKTPKRLCVGERFTWKGYFVTVTSMRQDSLVACTYKDFAPGVGGVEVGATIGYNPEWMVVSSENVGPHKVLKVVKAPENQGSRSVAKRFVIPYQEITKYRKSCKARLKGLLDKIEKCDPLTDADKLTKEVNASYLRHFELEEVRAAFKKRRAFMSGADKVKAWRQGAAGSFIDTEDIVLRVREDRVECSNGNEVSVAAVRRILPVVLARRNDTGAVEIPLDGHTVKRTSEKGVQIGCTLVPWAEVLYVQEALKEALDGDGQEL